MRAVWKTTSVSGLPRSACGSTYLPRHRAGDFVWPYLEIVQIRVADDLLLAFAAFADFDGGLGIFAGRALLDQLDQVHVAEFHLAGRCL